MRRVVRIAGITLAALIVLGIAAAVAARFLSERKMRRLVEVTVPPADFASASAPDGAMSRSPSVESLRDMMRTAVLTAVRSAK